MKMTVVCHSGLEPNEIHCALPNGVFKNTSVPLEPDEDGTGSVYSQCEVYTNYSSVHNSTEACPDGWTFSDEIHSIVSEVQSPNDSPRALMLVLIFGCDLHWAVCRPDRVFDISV